MSQEIYYTSAPEGLKPSTRGFCTVAASDGLPKPLWDRLESLSAYRHHFPSGSGQTNPTAHAHWIVTLAGREYHALSRVADSGMDYTQRTNAFAHHLIVESAEMAQAGPAWMLRQPGVMQTQWDGKVGPINRTSPLPAGSAGPAPCATWAQVTGDAGYAGPLAESAAKNPNRPVCILFSPGQDPLPLIDEVLRLLPAPVRWQVSFSTYFTSAPTTVLCAWRCCLAGTPAAEAGRRYAATGLFLDLTGGKLPPLVESPWTVLARTGQPIAAAAPKATLAKQPPAPPVPMQKPTAPKPDWAARQSPAPPPVDEPPLELAEPATPVGPRFSDEDLAAYNDLIAEAESRAAAQKQTGGYRASGVIQVDAPKRDSARTEDQEKLKKVSVLAVAILAVVAILVIVVFAVIMLRTTPPVEPVAPGPPKPPVQIVEPPKTLPTQLEPIAVTPQTKPAATEQVIVIPEKPPVEVPPVLVVLKQPLEWPKAGLGAKAQIIPLPKEVENIAKLSSLKILFGGKFPTTTIQANGKDASLFATSSALAPSATIQWKQSGLTTQLVSLEIKPKDSHIEFTWAPSQIMKSPEAAQAAYWLLMGSTLEVTDSKAARIQQIQFTPVVIENLSLSDSTSTITFPVDLPPGTLLHQKSPLPEGWVSAWVPGWLPSDPQPTPEKAFQILRYKMPIQGVADAAFELTFRNNMTTVESNLVGRTKQTERDIADLETQIKDKESAIEEKLKVFQKAVDDAKLVLALSDEELKAKMITRANAQKNLDDATRALDGKRNDIAATTGIDPRVLEEKKKLVAGNKLAIDAYREINTLDVEVLMPDKTPIATLKFSR